MSQAKLLTPFGVGALKLANRICSLDYAVSLGGSPEQLQGTFVPSRSLGRNLPSLHFRVGYREGASTVEIWIGSLLEGAQQARGAVAIIDVFRAFTTAAVVLANGAYALSWSVR